MSRQGEGRARTVENVLEFWNQEAREWGDSPQVTIRDHYFRLLEIEVVSKAIAGASRVLDIGCGTGFSTLYYAQVADQVIGADPAVQMLVHARRIIEDSAYRDEVMKRYGRDGNPLLRGNIRFEEADILWLPYAEGFFDAVVAERVLINLPTQSFQDDAARQVARVLRRGGTWALVEVTAQGHHRVDEVRRQFSLPPLEKYWHNLYVDEPHLEANLPAWGFAQAAKRSFDTYQFLTKVVHPWIIQPEEPSFLSDFNYAARVVSRDYPAYEDCARTRIDEFFGRVFLGTLSELAPAYVSRYQSRVAELVRKAPNFAGCSHQVLYLLRRMDG